MPSRPVSRLARLRKLLVIFAIAFAIAGFGLSVWEISADRLYGALAALIPPEKLAAAQEAKSDLQTVWLIFSGGALAIFLTLFALHFTRRGEEEP